MTRCLGSVAASVYFAVLCISLPSAGYELTTHGLLSLSAQQGSSLGTVPARQRIGLDSYAPKASLAGNREMNLAPFGSSYLELSNAGVLLRRARTFEQTQFPDEQLGFSRKLDNLSLESWIMRGAIREDDYPLEPFMSDDDPMNQLRPLQHFFDPLYNRPFTIDGVALGAKNPD